MKPSEKKAVLSGLGQSGIARCLDGGSLQMTLGAIKAAVDDAGLLMDDIDGVIAANPSGAGALFPGISGPEPEEVQDALRLRTEQVLVSINGIQNAVIAVAAGICRHVVVYRTVTEGSQGKRRGGRPPVGAGWTHAGGDFAWCLPIGASSAANHVALFAQRYSHEFGLTRQQLGWIPVTQRKHAARNPTAVYTDPITIDEYLKARMISSPLCLYDCDVPVDASTAVVVSTADAVPDLRRPIRIEAMAMSCYGRTAWAQWEDMTTMAHHDCAQRMWQRTDLKATDVDVAELYDGFSFLCLLWIEALGFCERGGVGSFVEGGANIALDGVLPLNTWGGQLSGGRVHAGFGHCAEAMRQLRGEAGSRQISNAEVAVWSKGIAHTSNCMLLTVP